MVDLVYRCLGFWVGFQLGPSEKGLYIVSDGSDNPQKGPFSTQIHMPRSRVECGRIGIPGNFRVLEVRIA